MELSDDRLVQLKQRAQLIATWGNPFMTVDAREILALMEGYVPSDKKEELTEEVRELVYSEGYSEGFRDGQFDCECD